MMGAIAAELADDIVLTDDNPRTESPTSIAAGIGGGIPAGKPFRIELDRARAIRDAILEAREGDVVVVAGKGHEDYQVYGQERRPFSDQKVVRAALAQQVAARAGSVA
jgi:UDP-N-acetylmuramoyl-L-alanyl-D-glutamate--2,6-diaminopimelate ligase